MKPSTPLAWALCGFGCAMPFSVAAANIGWGVVVAALLWRWRQGTAPKFSAARGPLWLPLWLYLGAALASDLLGVDPAHSLRTLNQDVHKLWIAALLSVAFASDFPPLFPAALAAGASAAASLGVLQYVFQWSSAPTDALRAHGFVHPVTFGEQMAVFFLGAFALAVASPPGGEGRGRRAAAGALGLLFAAALVFSNTRGAIAGAAAGAAAIVLLLPRLKRYAPAILCAAVALVGAADLMHPNRSLILQLIGKSDPLYAGNQTARFALWEVAARMGRDYPLTGVGVNNYRAVLPLYLERTFEDSQRSWGTAHNLYLHHFAERGLLGLAALGWLLWTMARRAWIRATCAPRFWSLWAWGATVSFLIMNLTEVALQTEVVWILVWTVWLGAEGETRQESA